MSISNRRHLLLFGAVCTLASLLGCGDANDPVLPEAPAGHWDVVTIASSDYLNNRFFRLDLPPTWYGVPGEVLGYVSHDSPGRVVTPGAEGQHIERSSIRIYRSLGSGPPLPGDLPYVAAGIDSSGIWDDQYIEDLTAEVGNWVDAWVWRPVEFTWLETVDGYLVAVDLGQKMAHDDILAVTYDVVDAAGTVVYEVGDQPEDGDEGGLDIEGQAYYRMKLLKPEHRDYYTYRYVMRNIYSLGGANIDTETFEITLETSVSVDQPDRHDDSGYTYMNVFGLDLENAAGEMGADGLADLHRHMNFDLCNGLLKFPLDAPYPFAEDEAFFRNHADLAHPQDGATYFWEWDGTRLENDRTPEIYNWTTLPSDYDDYGKFRFVARFWRPDQDE